MSWFNRTGDDDPIVCPYCGWEGTGRELDDEPYSELLERSCPVCDRHVELASFPTEQQILAAAAAGVQEAVAMADSMTAIAHQLEHRQRLPLVTFDDLPDLPPGASRILDVDTEDRAEPVGKAIVVRAGDTVLAAEPAFWKNIDGAERLLTLLQRRYGNLIDEIRVGRDARRWYCGYERSFAARLDDLIASVQSGAG